MEEFLANPLNREANRAYQNAVDEFSSKLVAHRGDFETYDKLLDYLLSRLIERDGDLKANKRLTRIVFYFMYWRCDIGKTEMEDASSDQAYESG